MGCGCSVCIAENLGCLIDNDTRVAVTNKGVRREDYDRKVQADGGHEGSAPRAGTPWDAWQQDDSGASAGKFHVGPPVIASPGAAPAYCFPDNIQCPSR